MSPPFDGIKLSILGDDAWRPSMVFVVGLDTLDGPPTEIVTLVSIPDWNMGYLRTDISEDPDQGIKNLRWYKISLLWIS
jgi:hypothetical protein